MTEQPKDPQNQNDSATSPDDNAPAVTPAENDSAAASDAELEAAEAYFASLMTDAEDTVESVTATIEETKEALAQLKNIYQNAEHANNKADKALSDIRQEAAETIAAIEKESAQQARTVIESFIGDLTVFKDAYEKTLTDISPESRTDTRFDKIVVNFEHNLGNLKKVFNKFSVKTEQPAPAATTEATAPETIVPENAAAPETSVPTQETTPETKTLEALKAESAALELQRAQLLQDIEKKQLSTQQINNMAQRVKADAPASIDTAKRQQEGKLPYAITPVVKELLPVIDTYEAGIKSYASEVGADTPVGKLLSDIKGHFESLTGIFNAHGVTVIAPAPHDDFHELQHNAWQSIPMEGFDDGVVISLQQKGYMLKDRVIRPAAVFATPE